jgi:hypothetical protein
LQNYATPSRKLKKLWSEWIDLHAVLSKGEYKGIQTPAAPFFSAASEVKCRSRILLVGKATAGGWWAEDYQCCFRKSKHAVIHDRLNHNLDFVRHGGNGGPFWKFFERLANINQKFARDSVVWSNVAKIGSLVGNPRGLLLSVQADLAERTMLAELEEYSPKIVIFVTGSDKGLDRIITRTLGVPEDSWISSERKDRNAKVSNVWWTENKPPAVWTRHPQGAKALEIEYWVKKLRELGQL